MVYTEANFKDLLKDTPIGCFPCVFLLRGYSGVHRGLIVKEYDEWYDKRLVLSLKSDILIGGGCKITPFKHSWILDDGILTCYNEAHIELIEVLLDKKLLGEL